MRGTSTARPPAPNHGHSMGCQSILEFCFQHSSRSHHGESSRDADLRRAAEVERRVRRHHPWPAVRWRRRSSHRTGSCGARRRSAASRHRRFCYCSKSTVATHTPVRQTRHTPARAHTRRKCVGTLIARRATRARALRHTVRHVDLHIERPKHLYGISQQGLRRVSLFRVAFAIRRFRG